LKTYTVAFIGSLSCKIFHVSFASLQKLRTAGKIRYTGLRSGLACSIVCTMITNYIVDTNVSGFLRTYDFVQYRKTCRELYYDQEAWRIRAKNLPDLYHLRPSAIHVNDPKHKMGLHYLLKWSRTWEVRPGSIEWLQKMVNWLQYKISIKILLSFVRSQKLDFFERIDWSHLSCRQKTLWEFMCFRNPALFKPLSILEEDGRPYKRMRYGISHRRFAQPCY